MRIAIHQINFCPYEGFWDKMKEVDKFILLTHTQFKKGGYENRFNYLSKWYTMSVNKGLTPLSTKRYVNVKHDWRIITEQFPQLKFADAYIAPTLFLTNIAIIKLAADIMNIDTLIERDLPTVLTSTDRLISICLQHEATEYLSGPSGGNYLDKQKFKDAGIKLSFQKQKGRKALVELIK